MSTICAGQHTPTFCSQMLWQRHEAEYFTVYWTVASVIYWFECFLTQQGSTWTQGTKKDSD